MHLRPVPTLLNPPVPTVPTEPICIDRWLVLESTADVHPLAGFCFVGCRLGHATFPKINGRVVATRRTHVMAERIVTAPVGDVPQMVISVTDRALIPWAQLAGSSRFKRHRCSRRRQNHPDRPGRWRVIALTYQVDLAARVSRPAISPTTTRASSPRVAAPSTLRASPRENDSEPPGSDHTRARSAPNVACSASGMYTRRRKHAIS